MAQLSFDWDWMDAPGVNGPELAATWARLCIKAGKSTVARVLDERAKTVREHLYVPLYPMAEWLAANWWFLAAEPESAIRHEGAFRRRHSLAANREGYAYPDLGIYPLGNLTRLVWQRGTSPWTKIGFLDDGELLTDSAEFREVCGDLLDSVVARLVGCGIEDSLLQQEWAAVREADAEETDFCRTAAGLGWDPYAIDDAKRAEVLALTDRFGVMLAEAIPVLNTDRTDEGWTVIEQALREAQRNTLSLERICSVRDRISGRGSSARVPWQAGQELAQALRGELGLDGEPLSTMDALGEALDEKAINAATKWTPVDGGNAILVDGLATCGEDDRPAFAFRTRRWEYGRRFHFCRALAEVLWRPGTNALLTPAHTERQQSNRAFAAEFLAPSVGLRNRVRRARLDEDDIDELAAEFGVSSMVIEHQLANHRIAKLPVGRPRAV